MVDQAEILVERPWKGDEMVMVKKAMSPTMNPMILLRITNANFDPKKGIDGAEIWVEGAGKGDLSRGEPRTFTPLLQS